MEWSWAPLVAPSIFRVKVEADWWINVLCLQGTNARSSPPSFLPFFQLADDSCWSLNKMSSWLPLHNRGPSAQAAHRPSDASLPLKISYSARGYSWLPLLILSCCSFFFPPSPYAHRQRLSIYICSAHNPPSPSQMLRREGEKNGCPEAQSVSCSSTPVPGSLSGSSHREALTHFIKLSRSQWS